MAVSYAEILTRVRIRSLAFTSTVAHTVPDSSARFVICLLGVALTEVVVGRWSGPEASTTAQHEINKSRRATTCI